jgi:hypothetical protein
MSNKNQKTMYRLECWDDDKTEWVEVLYSRDINEIHKERESLENNGYRGCDLRIVILDKRKAKK